MSLRRELKREIEALFEKCGLPGTEVKIETSSDPKKATLTVLGTWTGKKRTGEESSGTEASVQEDEYARKAEAAGKVILPSGYAGGGGFIPRYAQGIGGTFTGAGDESPEAQVAAKRDPLFSVARRELAPYAYSESHDSKVVRLLGAIVDELHRLRQIMEEAYYVEEDYEEEVYE